MHRFTVNGGSCWVRRCICFGSPLDSLYQHSRKVLHVVSKVSLLPQEAKKVKSGMSDRGYTSVALNLVYA
jgi:hypothetical protein